MVQYREKPFYLGEDEIQWVEEALASMTLEEKIGQLFCVTDKIIVYLQGGGQVEQTISP